MDEVIAFVLSSKCPPKGKYSAVSLFSGAGLSDLGYAAAGFEFLVHVEKDSFRAALGQDNSSRSHWLNRVVAEATEEVSSLCRAAGHGEIDLLVATPPCQGMSSSNPSRGRRKEGSVEVQEGRNRLLLDIIPYAEALKPRIIVAENVRQILTLLVDVNGRKALIVDHLRAALPSYRFAYTVIEAAHYGIAQSRKRAVIVGIRQDLPGASTFTNANVVPPATHSAQTCSTLRQWIARIGYERLESSSRAKAYGKNSLHYVPVYGPDRFSLVRDIPPYSGKSAYENDTCPSCKYCPVDRGRATCQRCGATMTNRPHVIEGDGSIRLIKGFASSYRRMLPDAPSRTITTNTSHIGSDFKIHPWEHRVLSALECADIQTVPRWFDWQRAFAEHLTYNIRTVIGEAFPPYFTMLHGKFLIEQFLDPKDGGLEQRSASPSTAQDLVGMV